MFIQKNIIMRFETSKSLGKNKLHTIIKLCSMIINLKIGVKAV